MRHTKNGEKKINFLFLEAFLTSFNKLFPASLYEFIQYFRCLLMLFLYLLCFNILFFRQYIFAHWHIFRYKYFNRNHYHHHDMALKHHTQKQNWNEEENHEGEWVSESVRNSFRSRYSLSFWILIVIFCEVGKFVCMWKRILSREKFFRLNWSYSR